MLVLSGKYDGSREPLPQEQLRRTHLPFCDQHDIVIRDGSIGRTQPSAKMPAVHHE